jgi:hypothetical protein
MTVTRANTSDHETLPDMYPEGGMVFDDRGTLCKRGKRQKNIREALIWINLFDTSTFSSNEKAELTVHGYRNWPEPRESNQAGDIRS